MATTICATQGDLIRSDTCMQEAYEQLWRAEVTALTEARHAESETERGTLATKSLGASWAWAIEEVMTVLEKTRNDTRTWTFF